MSLAEELKRITDGLPEHQKESVKTAFVCGVEFGLSLIPRDVPMSIRTLEKVFEIQAEIDRFKGQK